jgi:hypothetical protein
MARKSKKVMADTTDIRKKYEEAKALLEAAEAEDKNIIEATEKQIVGLCEANDIFCGVILTAIDVAKVVEIALTTGESVRIPFKLYYNE